MPQVFMMIAPEAQKELFDEKLKNLGHSLIEVTARGFGIEDEDDVTFTAVNVDCTVGEAPIQVEVRYTVGEDEYNREVPFVPSREQMDALCDAIIIAIGKQQILSRWRTSVWVRPVRDSVFK